MLYTWNSVYLYWMPDFYEDHELQNVNFCFWPPRCEVADRKRLPDPNTWKGNLHYELAVHKPTIPIFRPVNADSAMIIWERKHFVLEKANYIFSDRIRRYRVSSRDWVQRI